MKVETRPPSKGERAEQSWQIAIDLFTIAGSLGALVLPKFKGDEESLSVNRGRMDAMKMRKTSRRASD